MITTEDRLEILELYNGYPHLFDSGEAERWAALFTPDATFTVQPPGGGSPSRQVQGTAGLVDMVRKTHEGSYKKRGIRHEVSNIVIEAAEYGARGRAYTMIVRVGDGQPPQITMTGRYADELTRSADGWRFRSRTFFPDA